MVPLIKKQDEISILFEVRSHELQVQPGEVCLPGGRQEEGESSEECAIRETCEELCIKPSQMDVVGPLDYLNAYSNFTLYPYLCIIDHTAIKEDTFNREEVHETFQVPLYYFLENDPIEYTFSVVPEIPEDFPYHLISEDGEYNWRKGINRVPIYKYGNHTIWGLTARIIQRLAQILKEAS
jgi:8-oxo-dGTP pyrophosphatase MutT (NUDIX family)